MERTYSDWENLPAEILSNIFHFAGMCRQMPDPYNAKRVSSQSALVCKAWKNPAQSFLYSQVYINCMLKLRKFYGALRYSAYLGTMVKVLNLPIGRLDESRKAELLDIVTNLLSNYLPNLVSLYQNSYYHSYVPTLKALLESKLMNLKSIRIPDHLTDDDEKVHYASCAFLMRERLQEVYITDDLSDFLDKSTSELVIVKFQELYDNLNQFNDLATINITRKTDNGVQVLEHIVETCRSLRDVKITLSSMKNKNNDVQLKNDIDFDTISHYLPRANIKIISGHLYMSTLENSKVLLYIMKKFPNLEELDLNFNGDRLKVTPYAILQLLNHSVKIKKFSISNVIMNRGDIYNIIGNFWNTTSKPGVEKVTYWYHHHHDITGKTNFSIDKNPVPGTKIHLICPSQLVNRQPHIDLIENNGKFIGDLTFQFHIDSDELCDTPENFLIHIFTHCPNLRNLRIDKFKLHECLDSKFDKTKKYYIDKFTLKDCEIIPGILDQLSTVLSEVRQLRLIDTDCFDDNDNDCTSYINMPQTKIQCIILGLIFEHFSVHVKLFVVTEQKYYYYQSDTDTDSIKSSESRTKIGIQIDEKAYNEGGNHADYYICCQTKPEIIFHYYCHEHEIIE